MTDNRNRTASDVRSTFTKHGGNLAETGAVSFMFDHVGVIEYDTKVASADAMLDAAIEAGAGRGVANGGGHQSYARPTPLHRRAHALGTTIAQAPPAPPN